MRVRLITTAVLLSLLAQPASAGFVVTDWSIGPSVYDFANSQGHELFNGTPQNPFAQTMSAAYSNSVAQVAYQYNWDNVTGHFDTDIHLEAQGGQFFMAYTGDLVRFTTTTDVLLTVDAQYSYALAAGDRRAIWQLSVNTVPPSALGYTVGHSAAPTFGDPPTGTFNINFSRLLPSGAEYRFRSVFELESRSGSPTALSIGDGYARFTLTTVPEPAGLVILAIGGVFVGRRRRVAR